MIIGIDFSINSTAICITPKMEWKPKCFSFTPKIGKWHKNLSNIINVIEWNKIETTNEIDKMRNAKTLCYQIEKILINQIENPKFYIEGFSLGSMGNSFKDLIMYQTWLRTAIERNWGFESMNIVPPTTLKKSFTDKGNAEKTAVIERAIEIWKPWVVVSEYKKTNGEYPKPIDDISDALALAWFGFNK